MIEIKTVGGKVLFTAENATDVKTALVEAASKAAYLQGAYLQGADLRGADLQGADLQGADLQGADLQGADLQGADLEGAYLQGAYLGGAYLQGAYLRGAYLQGAYLQGADLRGADLQGAYLQGELWQKVAVKLEEALQRMNDGGRHWIKGSLTKELEDGSQAFCSVGSIDETCKDDGTVRALALWLLSNVTAGPVENFNDHDATTWEDIQAVFTLAAKHARRFAA